MTPHEELGYLINLLKEATQWQRNDNDRPALELEVDDRIKNLLEQVAKPVTAATRHSSSHTGIKTMAISIKGKKHRFPLDHLEKVPFKGSPTGYRWQLKDEFRGLYAEKI